jgi:hypothetical protein
MARRQDGSVRAVRTEVGTGERVDDVVVDSESLSDGIRKPRFTHVVIGWGLTRGATGTTFIGGVC